MTSGETTTDGTELVRRWFEELFNEGELSVADEILAANVEYRGPPSLSPMDVTTPEDVKEYVEVYSSAFPDLRYTVEDVTAADDRLYVKWSVVGTHESDLFGMEATGESFAVEGINIFVVEDGEITEVSAQWDTLKMVQELGTVSSAGLVAE